MKPKLLVLELWNVGDLALATPFLRQAAETYDVTLIAKPMAADLQVRLWPKVNLLPFNAPWTAFRGKYRIHTWPWKAIRRLIAKVRPERFDVAVSARWDPRDHLLMWLMEATQRLGFPRLGSQLFLTTSLDGASASLHRYTFWQKLATELGFELQKAGLVRPEQSKKRAVIHTGAGEAIRVWPLGRYKGLVRRLREQNYAVKVLCDANQAEFWGEAGEAAVVPRTLAELMSLLEAAEVFIGNDSGPGHLAAVLGIRTFTIFGPQLPSAFAPIHPASEWIEGASCPYKPCFDSCRFAVPHCLVNLDEETVCRRIQTFVARRNPA